MIRHCSPMVAPLLLVTGVLACAAGAGEEPVSGPPANLIVEVSRDMAGAVAHRVRIDPETIEEVIVGADVRGCGTSYTVVGVEFLPDNHKGRLELVAKGHVDQTTTGTKGPATAFNTTVTSFQARKPVFLTADGMTWCPAYSGCCAEMQLTGMKTCLKGIADSLVRRVAIALYYRDERQAKLETEEATSRRVNLKLDREAGQELAQGNQSFQEQFLRLRQQNLMPQPLLFRTTPEFLVMTGRLADEKAPLLIQPALPILGIPALSVRVQESAVNTAAERRFAGKTYTREELNEQLNFLPSTVDAKVRIKYPAEKEGKKKKQFTVTFVEKNPITTVFQDGKIRVTMSTAELKAGEEETTEPWRTTATYRISKTAKGVLLVREGALEIKLHNRPDATVPARLIVERTLTSRLFGGFLPEEVEYEELSLTGDLKRVGTLHTTQVESQAGWLLLAWKRLPLPNPQTKD